MLNFKESCGTYCMDIINVEYVYMDPHYQNLLQNGSRNPTRSALPATVHTATEGHNIYRLGTAQLICRHPPLGSLTSL